MKLVSKCLKGRIYDWWDDLQVTRQRKGKGKIGDWDAMKKKLNEKYFPLTCASHKGFVTAVTIQKQTYGAGPRSGQPFHKYSQACSLPSFGTKKAFVSGQQSKIGRAHV